MWVGLEKERGEFSKLGRLFFQTNDRGSSVLKGKLYLLSPELCEGRGKVFSKKGA